MSLFFTIKYVLYTMHKRVFSIYTGAVSITQAKILRHWHGRILTTQCFDPVFCCISELMQVKNVLDIQYTIKKC